MDRLKGYNARGLPGYRVLYNGRHLSAQSIQIQENTWVEIFKDGAPVGAYWGRDIDPECPPEGLPKRA